MPINYKDYPSNWKEIRVRILERAKHCCEFCGLSNYSLIHRTGKGKDDWVAWPEGMESEAWTLDGLRCTKIVLTIAHLDHDKSNHEVSDDRLRALCQKCHLTLDLPRHIENRKRNRLKLKNQYTLFG